MIKKFLISFLVLLLMPSFAVLANEDQKISVVMEYIVISPAEDGSTQIVNHVTYKNNASEEYTGNGQTEGVISVQLPQGATGLTFSEGNVKNKQTESGFVTTDSIPAGGTVELSYSYQLPPGKDIALKFTYPNDSYNIMLPEGAGSIDIKDTEFNSLGLLNMGENNFWGYSISNIKPNQTVTITYDKDKQPEGANAQSPATENQNQNQNAGNVTREAPDFHNPGHLRMWEQSMLKDFDPHILMIVLGAILIAGISYYSYFRWKNKVSDRNRNNDKEEAAFKLLMAKQKAILDKILELEETFEKGQISESDYHTKLEAYKQHLVQVKLSLNQFV